MSANGDGPLTGKAALPCPGIEPPTPHHPQQKRKATTRATFTPGQLVYVRDGVEGWAAATVLQVVQGSSLTVLKEGRDGQPTKARLDDVLLRYKDALDPVQCDCLTLVTPVNEASVLECLQGRFDAGLFYTAAGSTIMALNPFKAVPDLYDLRAIHRYYGAQPCVRPHIYMVAEKAYRSLTRELGRVDQSIVVSGESGAGKTVSAKHLLTFLTVVSSPDQGNSPKIPLLGNTVERRILDSNPILEAFGNAATVRNDNSSRFGKFIQLQFHRCGHIVGGWVQTYLLEKTRVMLHLLPGENNFHIFYQLLSLGEMPSFPPWLEPIRDEVLNANFGISIPQQDEALNLSQTVESMSDIGISPSTQVGIFQVLLAILYLASLKFDPSKDGESCHLVNDCTLQQSEENCAQLLGVPPARLAHCLLHRSIVSWGRGRTLTLDKPVSVREACSRRDCLAMLLYARLFDWLVSFINTQIKAEQFDHTISLLDIYGFETLETNSLEQLCINYANERLQQHYVVHFLRDLQVEYEKEGILWTDVTYTDNSLCVGLLDGPRGVFAVLNEEVSLSRRSDHDSLCDRLVGACGNQNIVRRPLLGRCRTAFSVSHYAGCVEYSVDGAVAKNKDNIPAELISLMESSNKPFVFHLFSAQEFARTEQSLTPEKTKKKKTILTKFKSSLDSLLSGLKSCDVHYIRCIKPNPRARPGLFDRAYVLRQLVACGVLDTVHICRHGYPARMTYKDFLRRYQMFLGPGSTPSSPPGPVSAPSPVRGEAGDAVVGFLACVSSHLSQLQPGPTQSHLEPPPEPRPKPTTTGMDTSASQPLACARILAQKFPSEKLVRCHLQFGRHKLFLTQTQLEHLELERTSTLSTLARRLQAAWRGHCCRRKIRQMHVAAAKIQAYWRCYSARRLWQKIKTSVRRLQRRWRVHRLLSSIKKLSKSYRVLRKFIEICVRRHRFRKNLKTLREQRLREQQERLLTLQDLPDLPELNGVAGDSDAMAELTWTLHQTNWSSVGATKLSCVDGAEADEDSCSDWSDDSGVMIREDGHTRPLEELELAGPPGEEQEPTLRQGRGIITCRQLTRPGYRFHVRKSVLMYGHVPHHADLPHGLLDALPDPAPGGTGQWRQQTTIPVS